jgi:hypothetical protein
VSLVVCCPPFLSNVGERHQLGVRGVRLLAALVLGRLSQVVQDIEISDAVFSR